MTRSSDAPGDRDCTPLRGDKRIDYKPISTCHPRARRRQPVLRDKVSGDIDETFASVGAANQHLLATRD
jgi:hypothetical protein